MKLDNLKARRSQSAGDGNRPPRGPAPAAAGGAPRRPNGWREYLARQRFPASSIVRAWELTDAEIESVLLDSPYNRALIERGGVVRADDYTTNYTVQSLGWAVIKSGWSIVPQDRPGTNPTLSEGIGEQRKPSKIPVQYKTGKWKQDIKEVGYAFLPTEWRRRRHSLREFLHLEHLFASNLAIQACEASGHIRVLDIDCPDPAIAARVRELASQHLGVTPFVRIGSSPKAQLLYRVEGEDVRIPKWSISIGDAEDGQAVEWLAEGSIITAYGLHHKTMRSFDWSEGTLHPAIAGPEMAPLITKAHLRAFVNALQQEWPVKGGGVTSNPYGAKAVATQFVQRAIGSTRYWTPRVVEGDWTMDADGIVVDGAERWMTAQSWAVCAANATRLQEVQGALIEWLAFEGKIKLLSSKRTNAKYLSAESIAREAAAKIRSASLKWRASIEHHQKTNRYHDGVVPWTIGDDGRRPVAQRVRAGDRPADGSLDWIPDEACPIPELGERSGVKVSIVEKDAATTEADRQARALIEDKGHRQAIADAVSVGVRSNIREWLSTVPAWSGELAARPWVLKAPTGAGKTVGTIDELAAFCAANPRKPGQGPILLVLPTHMNADEAMQTAVRSGMFAPELWTEEQLDQVVADLARRGVKIVRFRGREAAGCQRRDELRMLADKGIGASRLCGAEVEDGDEMDRRMAWKEGRKLEKIELFCPFREAGACGYYRQMSDLETADIVVLPHAYLTIGALPKALRKPRAVIVDESITYALLRQSRMPVSTLSLPRREPHVTKTDRKMWPSWTDDDIKMHYVGQREMLASHALHWLKEGKDVAAEIAAMPDGATMLHASITLCERANDRTRKVRPDLTPKQVEEIAKDATGSWLLDEIKFWKLVRERVEALAAGTAKGKVDARWQVVEHPATDAEGVTSLQPHLRLSWRVAPNWSGSPMLLLDASANPRIIAKLLGAEPEVRTVAAPMHVRTVAMIEKTWSNSSFEPRWDATDEEIKRAAQTIEETRRLITTVSVLYGHGRVLNGSTIAVREIMNNTAWTPPPNVDFCHFGALRGLDFAKHHAAAISIGRSEQPISVIDGYAAALTYDDDEPEAPYDVLGTGLTKEGKPLFRVPTWRSIKMRTGQDVDHLVPCMPPKPVLKPNGRPLLDERNRPVTTRSWGQELEESWREEELKQFLGRLRPVYRGLDDAPPPVWIAVGKILPEDVIVDELADLGSVIKAWPMAELVRIGGGVLADNVTPRLPGAQEVLQGRDLKGLAQELPKSAAFIKRWAAPFAHVRYRLDSEQVGQIVERSAMVLPGWVGGDVESHWTNLCEKHGGELPDVQRVSPPKLADAGGKAKAPDKRDVDRDDQLLAEIDARNAHHATAAAQEMGRVEFEIRRWRGEYDTPAE